MLDLFCTWCLLTTTSSVQKGKGRTNWRGWELQQPVHRDNQTTKHLLMITFQLLKYSEIQSLKMTIFKDKWETYISEVGFVSWQEKINSIENYWALTKSWIIILMLIMIMSPSCWAKNLNKTCIEGILLNFMSTICF